MSLPFCILLQIIIIQKLSTLNYHTLQGATTASDEYFLKCQTLHAVCKLLETSPQDPDTSRQLITYCIDNLHKEQFQANLQKVSIFNIG